MKSFVVLLCLPAAAQSSPWTLAAVQDALKKSGIPTRLDVEVEQPYLSVPGRVLVAPDGTEIQTYVYPNRQPREKESKTLDPKTAAPELVKPHWLMPVSLVATDNIILIVLSRSEWMHKKIADAFSPPAAPTAEVIPANSVAAKIVTAFHQALQKRDVNAVGELVANDVVVFENGERNDGWADFRDNHLTPEMKEPAPKSEWRIVRVKETPQMAWAYTHETFTSARGTPLVVWSVFVVEKRGNDWKITLLDWSIGRQT